MTGAASASRRRLRPGRPPSGSTSLSRSASSCSSSAPASAFSLSTSGRASRTRSSSSSTTLSRWLTVRASSRSARRGTRSSTCQRGRVRTAPARACSSPLAGTEAPSPGTAGATEERLNEAPIHRHATLPYRAERGKGSSEERREAWTGRLAGVRERRPKAETNAHEGVAPVSLDWHAVRASCNISFTFRGRTASSLQVRRVTSANSSRNRMDNSLRPDQRRVESSAAT